MRQNDFIPHLVQFSAVHATFQMVTFYLFDILRRHTNVHVMSTHHKADPTKLDKITEEIMLNVFQEKLRHTVVNPESKDATCVINTLPPVLTTVGKHTSFGTLERDSSLGEGRNVCNDM